MSLTHILLSMRALFVMGCLLATASGCGGASAEPLRARAAFDLRCPSDQIRIIDIDERAKGVTGCGAFATYIQSCRQRAGESLARVNCSWYVNHSDEKMGVGYMR